MPELLNCGQVIMPGDSDIQISVIVRLVTILHFKGHFSSEQKTSQLRHKLISRISPFEQEP